MKSISILVPMLNEAAVLPLFYETMERVLKGLPDYRFEYLFVDDGSTDGSADLVRDLASRDPRISLVVLSRNFGKERAMLAGLDVAETDATIVIDADLQDPPSLIPKMIELWEQGWQDVYAQRRSRAGESWLKRSTAHAYYRVLQSVSRVGIQEDTGDFRLLDRDCVMALRQYRESERNMKALFSLVGFRKIALPFDRDVRAAGGTKFNYWKLSNLAVDGITSFTTLPLRLSSIIGLIVSVAAFVYLVVIVVKAIFDGGESVAGYPSLMAVILFLGGVQLLSLGVIGEYIARIFSETKARPVYLTSEVRLGVPGPSVERREGFEDSADDA
ncbi:MAG: glycosyltransferase family 2 protein [Microbacterium sp.]|nr:glycosyltransferase family 2 protein [Microbacterium sp.]